MGGVCDALLVMALAAPMQVESGPGGYTLPVRVDEVSLVFSASDFEGAPINDMTLADMRLLDNGRRQTKIVKFEHRTELPLRAGFLVDVSGSMAGDSPRVKLISSLFAEKILRAKSDQAFVMRFAGLQRVGQDWTGNSDELRAASSPIGWKWSSLGISTAMYDSVYITVRDQFAKKPDLTTGTANVILLFSDGVDDSSHARLQDVMDIASRRTREFMCFMLALNRALGMGRRTCESLRRGPVGGFFMRRNQRMRCGTCT